MRVFYFYPYPLLSVLSLTLLTHPVEVTADGGKELNIFLSQYSERGAPTLTWLPERKTGTGPSI